MEEKKVHVNKDDELPIIAAKVFTAKSGKVILVVPRLSKFAKSAENLKFIKKGLDESNKTLTIESVDEQLLRLAKEVKIDAYNPFFEGKSVEEWSQSLPETVLAANADIEIAAAEKDENGQQSSVGDEVFAKAEKEINKAFRLSRRRFSWKFSRWLAVIIMLIMGGAVIGLKILPRTSIILAARKTDWNFENQILIKKKIAAANLTALEVPGQLFSQKKNIQLTFPTTQEKYVEQKAIGKLTIYNSCSDKPQPLVATTRFQAPDGKIIRINKGITVPGARIIEGQIAPSSVEVDVTADKGGEDYNIGPISRLTIPGFKRNPKKYRCFYGELKQPLTGGYAGRLAAPTEDEIAKAKEKTAQVLKKTLTVLLASQIPSGFEVPKKGFQFRTLNSKVSVQNSKHGKFSLFMEGELAVIGFRKSDLLALLGQQMSQELGKGYKIKGYKLTYQIKNTDFNKGELLLAIAFSATAEKAIDLQDFRRRVAGKSAGELRAAIFAMPELESAKVSFWPFWVDSVPKDIQKIRITVD